MPHQNKKNVMNNNQIIDPKSEYQVYRNGELNTTDFQILTKLYLPIIGAHAFALVISLWNNQLVRQEHFMLMNEIGIDGGSLYQARKRLEGVSLVKTFKDEKGNISYLLEKPLNANKFFNNALLSEVLLEMVGETKYLALAKELLPKEYDFSLATEISHDFLDVYAINKQNITNPSDTIKNVQKTISEENDDLFKQQDNLDFNLILNILSNSFVNLSDVKKNHKLFVDTNLLYGIDELSMTKLIEQATNLATNHFDAQKFKILVSRENNTSIEPAETDEKSSSPKIDVNFTSEEQQLINTAKNYAPLVFLSALKQEKKGFVTNSEERIISQLVEKMVIKTDVINMLIYLLLVDRNYPTLNKNLVDTIANDWAQNQIQSAEQALEQIKTRDRKISTKKAQKRQQYKQQTRLNVKETLPDWAQDQSGKQKTVSSTRNDEKQKQELAKKLEKYNKKKRGGN